MCQAASEALPTMGDNVWVAVSTDVLLHSELNIIYLVTDIVCWGYLHPMKLYTGNVTTNEQLMSVFQKPTPHGRLDLFWGG